MYPEVPINSYQAFANYVLGKGFDTDGYYGYQCADLIDLLYIKLGRRLSLGGGLYVYMAWTILTAREANGAPPFSLVYNKSDIQTGDIVVLNRNRFIGDNSGHIAYANQNYNGTDLLSMLGQNQVDPNPDYGHVATINDINISSFLGAFRYSGWNGSTPIDPPGPLPWQEVATNANIPLLAHKLLTLQNKRRRL